MAAAGTPHAGGGYPSRRIDYIFVGEARAGFYPSQCSSTTLYQVFYRIFVWGKETPRLVEVARAQRNNDATAARACNFDQKRCFFTRDKDIQSLVFRADNRDLRPYRRAAGWPATSTSAAWSAQGSVALSRCATAHPPHTRIARIVGTSASGPTVRPNARSVTTASAGSGRATTWGSSRWCARAAAVASCERGRRRRERC